MRPPCFRKSDRSQHETNKGSGSGSSRHSVSSAIPGFAVRTDRASIKAMYFRNVDLPLPGSPTITNLGISEEGGLDINRPGISILFGVSLRVLVEHDTQTDVYVAEWDFEYAIVVDPRHVEPMEVALGVLVIRCRWRDWWESNITSCSLGTHPWSVRGRKPSRQIVLENVLKPYCIRIFRVKDRRVETLQALTKGPTLFHCSTSCSISVRSGGATNFSMRRKNHLISGKPVW